MSRRDTIIVAVLVNTGLLAVLFMLAMHNETSEEVRSPREFVTTNMRQNPFEAPTEPSLSQPRDELDQVLKNYPLDTANSLPVVIEDVQKEPIVDEPAPAPEPIKTVAAVAEEAESSKPANEKAYVEITVKRGDYLEKIARSNGTTIEAIMRANKLSSERIDIGQVLKVPLLKKKIAEAASPKKNQPKKQDAAVGDTQYYTLKTGDNPWKIAKEFHVKFDELLKLNNLDEEKARGLMPGDILRVR